MWLIQRNVMRIRLLTGLIDDALHYSVQLPSFPFRVIRRRSSKNWKRSERRKTQSIPPVTHHNPLTHQLFSCTSISTSLLPKHLIYASVASHCSVALVNGNSVLWKRYCSLRCNQKRESLSNAISVLNFWRHTFSLWHVSHRRERVS